MAALSELALPGYHEFDHVARQAVAACLLPYQGHAESGEPGVRQGVRAHRNERDLQT